MEDLIIYDGSCNYYNCIYLYVFPNGKKYVGQAKDLMLRHKAHLKPSSDLLVDRAIRKYGDYTLYVLCYDLEDVENMNAKEKEYIIQYNTLVKDGYGYNVAEGGEAGNTMHGWSEERKEEYSRKMSEVCKGRVLTEEHKSKIGQASKERWSNEEYKKAHSGANNPMYGKTGELSPNYGRKLSEEAKNKLREVHLGKPKSKEAILKSVNTRKERGIHKGSNNGRAKKTAQYSKDGTLIKIWDYAKQASEELGLDLSSICKCCNGKAKSCGGFVWKYVD